VRKCCDCKRIKSIKEFYKFYDGYQKRCKKCTKKRNKIFNIKNPEYKSKYGKSKYKQDKLNNPNFNQDRYKHNKKEYLLRRYKWSKTIKGRMYDLLEAAKNRCRQNHMKFDINLDWLINQFNKQDGKCAITKIKFTFIIKHKRNFSPFNPSLHRINNNKGYTKNNVLLVCTIFNLGMNCFSKKYFTKMCKEYYKYNIRKG
jgi:hypothetical protein